MSVLFLSKVLVHRWYSDERMWGVKSDWLWLTCRKRRAWNSSTGTFDSTHLQHALASWQYALICT